LWTDAERIARQVAENAAWDRGRAQKMANQCRRWITPRSAASAALRALHAYGSRQLAVWLPLAETFEAGLGLFWVLARAVIVVPRPAIHVETNRLHRAYGPAVQWPHAAKYFFWRGLQVPEHLMTDHPSAISV